METMSLAGAAQWAFGGFAQVAGPAAVAALWQGAALAGALALCLRLAPRSSASDRYRIWAAGLVALAALPFLPLLISPLLTAPHADSIAGSLGAVAPPAQPWLQLDPRWMLAIAGLWIALSLARAADLGVHSLRLRRLWKRAIVVKHFPSPSGISGREFEICTTHELDRPSVIGFFRPRILIPEWLLERLTENELEQVVLHEAEHLRRRDDWTNLLQKLCLVLFPLNPALAWIERRLCREREMACDDAVVRATRAPRAYAACLASLAERRFEHRADALSLGAWQRRPELAVRVHRILRRAPALHPAARTALLGMMSCGLIFGSVELASCPQLVAFVAAPRAGAIARKAAAATAPENASRMMVNTAYLAGGRSDYKMMDAVARMPPTPAVARAENRAAQVAEKLDALKGHDFSRAATVAKSTRPLGPEGRFSRSSPDFRSFSAASVYLQPVDSLRMMAQARTRVSSEHAAEVETALVNVASSQPQQQWIMFTEWEQVESSAPSQAQAPNVSVYGQAQNRPGARSGQVTQRVTITRLVWAIYPVDAVQGSAKPGLIAPGATASGTTNQHSGESGETNAGATSISRPVVAPFANGWLVIQL